MIANELGVSISTKINPEYVRPNDNRVVVGSNEKIRNDIGWKPSRNLSLTLRDMVLFAQQMD